MRFLSIGAHPDDCEILFGGTAAKLSSAGHAVKFLAVTDGSAGHHQHQGAELARIRAAEAAEAARRLGITASEILPNQDGELLPTLAVRQQIVQQIREWRADVVLTHRPFDYHPDHRYTSQLVADSAYLVQVPSVCPDAPPLSRNPIYLYFEDTFTSPLPFRPDAVVPIDDVWQTKICGMDAHRSQFYEWLPWIDGEQDQVPAGTDERRAWLERKWTRAISDTVRAKLNDPSVVHAEAFEVCEYGSHPSPEQLAQLFPR